MKFQRKAKIFKGRVDAAPLASILFLLLIFVVLHSSLVFAPGIKVELADFQKIAGTNDYKIVTIRPGGEIEYNKQIYTEKKFIEKLLSDAKKKQLAPVFIAKEEPGASRDLYDRLRAVMLDAGSRLEKPAVGLTLPEGEDETGVPEGAVIVAINRNGEFFYQHQIISETDLQNKLAILTKSAGKPVTLVFEADKNIEYDTVVRLSQIAKKAGLGQVLWATRQGLKPNWPISK